jgi:hypothetical protein
VRLLVETEVEEFEVEIINNADLSQLVEEVTHSCEDYSITLLEGQLWDDAKVRVDMRIYERFFADVRVDRNNQLRFCYKNFEPTNDIRNVVNYRFSEIFPDD